jgi:hypothetical protein
MANGEFRDTWLNVVPNKRSASVISRYYDHVNTVRRLTMSDFESQRLSLYLMETLMDGFIRRDLSLCLSRWKSSSPQRATAISPSP